MKSCHSWASAFLSIDYKTLYVTWGAHWSILMKNIWLLPPTSLKVDFFPTASVANINLEKISSLATTLLHGTASSISQHPADSLFRAILPLSDSSIKLLELSQWQTDAVLFHLLNDITVPVLAPTSLPIVTSSTHAMNQP